MSITVKDVSKRFGEFLALDQLSLEVPSGALLALLGPSGSGKTTLLRIIAGLEIQDSGTVLYQDEDVTGARVRDRNVGFVFQHYALFRHMSVFENIAFGLRVRHWSRARVKERVHELLRLIQLEGLEHSLPSQLSGGQRQRVALARALAVQPKVLLLDEPFGALDAKVRQELRQWLRRLHEEIHVTSVFVTHDQEEAFEVADRVVIMNQGRIEQAGTPQEIFEQPANPFVMDFLGNVNVFHGRVQDGRADLGGFNVEYPEYTERESRAATAFVRSHELDIQRVRNGRPALQANVVHINPARTVVKVRLHAEEFGVWLNVDLGWERYNELQLRAGESVFVLPRRMRVFVQDYQI
ncbi:MAG: sulfate/molybdate ABC transporter ATP-binding protein [Deltaproteobacteria bacterium]|nr:sulfate/molybdate ABC transporter ATP-binding protein [Deltaproteobacteria bacterium]